MIKKLLARNSIVITSLAIMIAVAGYLNFTNADLEMVAQTMSQGAGQESADGGGQSKQEELTAGTLDLSDGDDLPEEKDEIGEAVLTQAEGKEYAAGVRLEREQAHAKTEETLSGVIENSSVDEETKREAMEKLTWLAQMMEKELATEQLLESKGFDNAVVSIDENSVDVLLNYEELDEAQRAQVEDIVTRKTGYALSQIIISPMKK